MLWSTALFSLLGVRVPMFTLAEDRRSRFAEEANRLANRLAFRVKPDGTLVEPILEAIRAITGVAADQLEIAAWWRAMTSTGPRIFQNHLLVRESDADTLTVKAMEIPVALGEPEAMELETLFPGSPSWRVPSLAQDRRSYASVVKMHHAAATAQVRGNPSRSRTQMKATETAVGEFLARAAPQQEADARVGKSERFRRFLESWGHPKSYSERRLRDALPKWSGVLEELIGRMPKRRVGPFKLPAL